MPVKPLAPDAAVAVSPPDDLVTFINTQLSRPWTPYDISQGRRIKVRPGQADFVQAAAALFRAEDWDVRAKFPGGPMDREQQQPCLLFQAPKHLKGE